MEGPTKLCPSPSLLRRSPSLPFLLSPYPPLNASSTASLSSHPPSLLSRLTSHLRPTLLRLPSLPALVQLSSSSSSSITDA